MENEIITKLSIVIHLVSGIIFWYFAKDKTIKAADKEGLPVSKEFVEIIILLASLLCWELFLIRKIYNWCLKKPND